MSSIALFWWLWPIFLRLKLLRGTIIAANIGQAMVNLKLWLSKSSSLNRQLHGGRGLNSLGYHAPIFNVLQQVTEEALILHQTILQRNYRWQVAQLDLRKRTRNTQEPKTTSFQPVQKSKPLNQSHSKLNWALLLQSEKNILAQSYPRTIVTICQMNSSVRSVVCRIILMELAK